MRARALKNILYKEKWIAAGSEFEADEKLFNRMLRRGMAEALDKPVELPAVDETAVKRRR